MTATFDNRTSATWDQYRGRLEEYFDRTALDAWAQLTSDAPVSKIRATVRAGRGAMRDTLLSWLPADLTGRRILDAGHDAGHDAVLVVSHGAALRTWTSSRMLPDQGAPAATDPLHNTALIVLEGDMDTGWRLVSWQGGPAGGAFLDDHTAADPTGDLDADDDGRPDVDVGVD